MSIATLMKSPDDLLDYDIEYDDWLETGDRITDWSATVEHSTAVIDRGEYTDRAVRLWISGGDDGDNAHIDVEIETLLGRRKTVCFKLRIKECR